MNWETILRSGGVESGRLCKADALQRSGRGRTVVRMRTRALGLVAVIFVATVAFAACSPLPDLGLVPSPSGPAESSTADGGALSASSVLALPTGTIVDKAQIQAVANEGVQGVGFYNLANGNVVLVHSDQPLPANVTADISAKATTINPKVSGDLTGSSGLAIQMNALNFVNSIKSQTGKQNVCAVLPTVYTNLNSPGSAPQPGWGAYGCPPVEDNTGGVTGHVIFTSPSKDAAIAKAKELMASQTLLRELV